ncbi:MAG: ADOP family duplicated permease [Bryobacteraceae bacterium]
MREFLNRLASFFQRTRQDRELDAELQSHLAFAIDEQIARGLSPEEARRQAMIRFGGWETAKEIHRETRSLPFLECLLQDLHYALRAMRREPGFTAFAILVVALGIGASTTIFSVLSTVLVRPLPFHDPERLAWVANAPPEEGLSSQTLQVLPYLSFKERNHSFSDMAAYFAFYGVGDSRLQVKGEIERLNALPVSQNFFPLLGVQPEIGRLFSAEECKWNGPKAVLLSHGLWERRFASDPHIVGRSLTLDDEPVHVIGVLPASFDFGSVFAPGTHMDLYFAFPLTPETDRWGNTISVVGRLKPGVSLARAQAEATPLGNRISSEPHRGNNITPQLSPLQEHVSGRLRPALLVLAFAVGTVMLIVCANLSNLLLVRGAARQKEFAIRGALGADKERLIRQVLTESLLLSFCGAALGASLAFAGTRALARLTTFNIPLLADVRLDFGALLFTLVLAVVSGVVFGLVPALQVPKLRVNDALKDQHRGSTDSRRHAWIRSALVVSEIAFACVLMVGTGLLIHSFLRVLDVNLGFQPARAAAMRVDPSAQVLRVDPKSKTSSTEQANAYFNELLRRVRELPGVEAAGLTDALPLGRNRTWGAAAQGVVYKRGEYPSAFVHVVTDGYLKAAGIPLKDGRDLSERDTAASEPVILINETLGRQLWPGQNPLGRLIDAGPGKARRVVGFVDDVRHLALEQASGAEMYFPIRQVPDYGSVHLVVRSRLDESALSSSVRRVLLPLNPGLPKEQFHALQQVVDRAVSPRRFIVLLLSGFALFALVLASLGIYAVISYSVGQRTQEIGIRMALGASPGALQKTILLQTLLLAAAGLLLGTAAAATLTRALRGLLFGITPTDPVTFAGMLIVLTSVAAAAGYLPARRASRIDPMIALRAD